jgi:hypothetical protein
MEAVAIGDLHLTDAAGTGGLSKYIADHDQMVVSEAEKVLVYARNQGIDRALLLGDSCDGPRMSYPAMTALSSMFSRNDDITFEVILG